MPCPSSSAKVERAVHVLTRKFYSKVYKKKVPAGDSAVIPQLCNLSWEEES
jgi:hypothetical protein